MKRPALLLSLLAVLSLVVLRSSVTESLQKKLKKDGYVFVPSGSITENGVTKTIQGFYISSTEVSNSEYRAFLSDLKKQGKTEDLAIAQIDSAKWTQAMSYNEPFTEYYASHPAYDHYPVVNVSHEAAKMYCTWLSEQYKAEGFHVYVRLPVQEEWIYAAQGGHPENEYAWNGNYIRNKKGAYLCNFKDTTGVYAANGIITAPQKSFVPNDYGIYNMCGNVAEMLMDPGTHKGGSWNTEMQFVSLHAPDPYAGITEASPFIGFRTIIAIVE